MCFSPLWRTAVPEAVLRAKDKDPQKTKGYRNGAFVYSPKNTVLFEWLSALFPIYAADTQEIPCGQCIECRLNKSKEWAQRCIAEAQMSDRDCFFLTLTYDDEFIPEPILTFPLSLAPGEVLGDPVYLSPLVKEDMTKFLKDLRRYFEYHYDMQGIRFLYCGEYGENTHRCHFHCLLFNIKIEDLELAFNRSLFSGKDIPYFKSDIISKIWNKGFVSISPLTWENAAYTCRYVLKKKKGVDSEMYLKLCESRGVTPLPYEFINMSRDPGIGRAYYEENKGFIYNFDLVQLPNGKQVKPCSYYDDLYDLEFPEALEAIKLERQTKLARSKLNAAFYGSSSSEERIEKRKRTLTRNVKRLKRDL